MKNIYKFCPYCGGPVSPRESHKGKPVKFVCEKDGNHAVYVNPKQAVSVILIDIAGRVLLGWKPAVKKWEIPGGILNPGEHPVEAAKREIEKEEIKGIKIKITGFLGFVPEMHEGTDCLGIYFTGKIRKGDLPQSGEEHSKFKWFPKNKIPKNIVKMDKMTLEELRRRRT